MSYIKLMIRYVLWCVCGLFLLSINCQAQEMTDGELYARAACLMDGDSGRILYGKEEKTQLPMASTTKIMTCILALERGGWNEIVTVSEYASSQPKVHMGAEAGEQFLLGDLLYALMLNSDNDAAVMIGEHISGSVEQFADEMNEKAREIGCLDTHFVTPNGLDGENEEGIHSTTASDLARMLRYCICESNQKELFLEITRMPSYTFWNVEHTKTYQCTNHNLFLNMMDGALTGKTGFTAQAGYCYVGALKWDDKLFIVSLLACGWPNNKGYKWSDTRKLMSYGLSQYAYRNVFEEKKWKEIPVKNGVGENTQIGEEASAEIGYEEKTAQVLKILLRSDEKVQIVDRIPDKLYAPVEAGQKIGETEYYLNGVLLKTYPVIVKEDIKKKDYRWCVDKIREKLVFSRVSLYTKDKKRKGWREKSVL